MYRHIFQFIKRGKNLWLASDWFDLFPSDLRLKSKIANCRLTVFPATSTSGGVFQKWPHHYPIIGIEKEAEYRRQNSGPVSHLVRLAHLRRELIYLSYVFKFKQLKCAILTHVMRNRPNNQRIQCEIFFFLWFVRVNTLPLDIAAAHNFLNR